MAFAQRHGIGCERGVSVRLSFSESSLHNGGFVPSGGWNRTDDSAFAVFTAQDFRGTSRSLRRKNK